AATFVHNTVRARATGLDLTTPLEATRDAFARKDFLSVKDQRYWHGVLAEFGFAFSNLDLRFDPRGDAPYIVEPGLRHGNFFMRSRSVVDRLQAIGNFMPRPLYGHGRHELKFGFDLDRIHYLQFNYRRSFQTLREHEVPWRITSFQGSPGYTLNNW